MTAPVLLTAMVFAAGVAPPVVNANAKLVGLRVMVGFATGAVTVIDFWTVPVPPPKLSIAAAHTVTVVFAVTVGAVQLKVQLGPLGALCTNSPLEIFVLVPATKVPAEVATSRPAAEVPPVTVSVKLLVEPEATDVGPVKVTPGAVPELWQEVQVEPLLPENPEMPLPVALAGRVKEMRAQTTRPRNSKETVFLVMEYSLRWTGFGIASTGGAARKAEK
jgi:hypothetical protein